MIRRIRFDSSNKNNIFNNYDRNNVSFGGPLYKYGIPRRDLDEFRPQPMDREEKEPPMIKYGYPQAPFEPDETNINNTERTTVPEEESRFKYGIPQTIDDSEESDENIAEELNSVLFGEEDDDAFPKAEAPKQKTSYLKRLWLAILGKDTQ